MTTSTLSSNQALSIHDQDDVQETCHVEDFGTKSATSTSDKDTNDLCYDIHSLFATFNERFFWGKLHGVEISWNSQMLLAAGRCDSDISTGRCLIKLSAPILNMRPHSDLVDILLHEMIHAYLFQTKAINDHGLNFHYHKDRINKKAGTNIALHCLYHRPCVGRFPSAEGQLSHSSHIASPLTQTHRSDETCRSVQFLLCGRNRTPLTPAPTSVDDNEAPLLQLVVWAPRGSGLAFVYQNDIYYKPKAKGQVFRLTSTGSSVLSNGVPDWIYQEELMRTGRAIWFAPDGKSLVFTSFNDSLVGQLKYPFYGPKSLYPRIHSIRYPKPGTINPEVRLWLVNVTHPKTFNTTQLSPTPVMLLDSQLPYLIDVSWAGDRHVAVVWMNRRQNLSTVAVCSNPTWTCQDSYVQKSSRWVEPSAVLFSDDHSSYLTLLPVLDGDAGHFTHVCHVDRESHQVTPLTHGQLTVTGLLAWDNDNHIVYFEAAPERKPSQRHVYRVSDIVNITTPMQWECLTCPQYPVNGSNITSPNSNETNEMYPVKSMSCLYTRATFAQGTSPRFYILECLGPETPMVVVMNALTNTKVRLLDSNSVLAERYASMARPQIKIFQVEVESGYHAQVRLMLPPGLREYEEMSFPLILKVGTTPGSQSVTEQWGVDWSTYLVSQRNFIVAEIDGRGSGFQGDRMKHEVYHRLGQNDVEDQISVITYLRDNLRFIDRTRMGVWGKGYGGFATAMILSQDTGLFHCGISLAPITSWAHYDSVFTERFMGTPNVTDNYRGYEESDLSKKAGNLRDKPFLLIHGSADNTVHFQHSMILVHALTQEGVMFRHQTYPDEGHMFDGVRSHLYRAMEAFWDECFGPLDFIEWEIGSTFFSFKQ